MPIPNKLQPWIAARQLFRLSHAHIQMARELGLNPKKLGSLDNHRQEQWKQPLPEFIATLYEKRFGVRTPAVVRTIEETVAANRQKKPQRKATRAADAQPPAGGGGTVPPD